MDNSNLSQLSRYKEVEIEYSLKLTQRYPLVCNQLSHFLRIAFSKFPKNIQFLIFQHTLSAFRLLPMMQTQKAVSAANALIQSAEAVLPKQKKVVAVKEFKNAKVSYKRRSKERQQEGSLQLPEDVIVHIFSFLDLRSLISASSVCWTWNSAASDNHLWNSLYSTCFRDTRTGNHIDWKKTFKEKYEEGGSMDKLLLDRGFCEQCKTIVWVSNMNCPNKHAGTYCSEQQLKPVSSEQIVEYVLNGILLLPSSFENDSDYSDDEADSIWGFRRIFLGPG